MDVDEDESEEGEEDEDGSPRKRYRAADGSDEESGKLKMIRFSGSTNDDTADEDFVAEESDSEVPEEFDEDYESANSSDDGGRSGRQRDDEDSEFDEKD
jgi:hypothetical protein